MIPPYGKGGTFFFAAGKFMVHALSRIDTIPPEA